MSGYKQVRHEIEANDPPIEVGQIWEGRSDGEVLRTIRILAPYPEKDEWIFEDLGIGKLKTRVGELGRTPEFNLRYVMRPAE